MPKLSEQKHARPLAAVEVSPGLKVLPVDLRRVPQLAVFEWAQKPVTFADGTRGTACVPVLRIREAWMRISEVEKLPLGLSAEVIARLVRGGFVEGAKAAPNNSTVNVLSLLDHIETTRRDPDYWTPSRRKRYRDGDDGGQS